MSAKPFLQELGERVEEFSIRAKRKFYLIAESDLNDSRVIRPRGMWGYGLDAQWCDDFHHSLHTLLTGETSGYYIDFGTVKDLEISLREGFVYSDKYSVYRKRHHGNTSKDLPGHQFVVFSQNHDQVGNRMLGDRLSTLVNFEGLKLAAATVLISPYIPLLFMGEEYGEESPFLYFISHSDPELIRGVREGRKKEFEAFNWDKELPDPQSVETFLKCKLTWEKRFKGNHKVILNFYQQIIKFRKEIPALANLDKNSLVVSSIEEKRILFLYRWYKESRVFCILGFHKEEVASSIHLPSSPWKKLIDSSEKEWGGPGSSMPELIGEQKTDFIIKPFCFVLYEKLV
jgi:maltooligosyltrehalose trehalohydrolase